jgi:hypothetical protein
MSAVMFNNEKAMDFPNFVMYPNEHPGGSHCSICVDSSCDGMCGSDAEDPGWDCDGSDCEVVDCDSCVWDALCNEKQKRKKLYIESIRPESSTTTKHANGGGGGAAGSIRM